MKKTGPFHQHDRRLDISWEKYGQMAKKLAKEVKDNFDPNCVVGNSKGGCIVGATLAAILRLDFYPMRVSKRINDEIVFKEPKIIVRPPKDVLGKKTLLVDDMSSTGQAFKLAKKILEKEKPKEIKTLALARHKDSFIPDFCGLTSDDCIAFPWDKWIYTGRGFTIHPELIVKSNKVVGKGYFKKSSARNPEKMPFGDL